MLDGPLRSDRADALDVMRAVLAIWVMFAHVVPWSAYYVGAGPAPNWLADATLAVQKVFQSAGETHPAVLAFIVLSGYCIHRNGLRQNRTDIGAYALRRAFRIYPIYLLAILAGIAGWMISQAITLDPSREIAGTQSIEPLCVAAKAVGVVTVWPELHRCAFAGNAPLNTVMTEIWLYAAYPLILLGLGRLMGARLMFLSVVAVWGAGVAAVLLNPELRHWWNSASLPGFLLYWWIGALAIEPRAAVWVRRLLPASIAATAGMSWLTMSGETGFLAAEAHKIALAFTVAGLITFLDAPFRIWRPAAFLGKAGYSLYAFHGPVTGTLLVAGASWWQAIVAGIVTGCVMYVLVERPGISLGRAVAGARVNHRRPLSP